MAEDALLYADHVDVGAMGEYTREFKFKEPVLLQKMQVLQKGEKASAGSGFEGKTFPNVRTMSLNVYAVDKVSRTADMPRLLPLDSEPGCFVPGSRVNGQAAVVTDCIVVRGEFMRLSVAFYGRQPPASDLPEDASRDAVASLPSHLRPTGAFEQERLDLTGMMPGEEGKGGLLAEVLDATAVEASDGGAPTSLTRALGMPPPMESNARIAEHAQWVASLVEEADVLEADAVVTRLEQLIRDFGTLAQGAQDSVGAHVQQGPLLAGYLLNLISRTVARLEFRPLRAAIRALAAALCVAPTVAEVLKRGGLAKLLSILRDSEWCQLGHKLASIQALLNLCSHAIGMEAFLGWSTASEASTGVTSKASSSSTGLPDHVTGYDLVLTLLADAEEPGLPQLEPIARVLLQRAAFYAALAKLDSACARLSEASGVVEVDESEEVVRTVIEALVDVATQLEEVSQPEGIPSSEASSSRSSLLSDDGWLNKLSGDKSSVPLLGCKGIGGFNGKAQASSGGADEAFSRVHPQLHGFIESFLTSRRLLSNLCIILRRFPKLSLADRLATFEPLRRILCALVACVGGAQFLTSEAQNLNTLLTLLDAGSVGTGAKASASELSNLPAIPRFPGHLALTNMSAPQLAALVSMHVRAHRLCLLLVMRTRQKGRDGLLPEDDALPLLQAMHQLCARGAAGAASVVCAFRSAFLVEWLLRQLEGRLEEASLATATPPQPSVRHLVAILYALLLRDPSAAVADRFGPQILALATRGLEVLEAAVHKAEGADGSGLGGLEFALDSDDASLAKAVRVGRKTADSIFVTHLREIVAQLKPWQQAEGEPPPPGVGEMLPAARLLACLQLPKTQARSLKRSTDEEHTHQLAVRLGGYSGADAGVEVAEVDFAGIEADEQEQLAEEKRPSGDLQQLPLVSMRLLCRKVSAGVREAIQVVTTEDKKNRDAIAMLVPVLIRCAAAIDVNIEANIVQETEAIDTICATQYAHAQLLEAALQACYHMLNGLRQAGVPYRHTELLQTLFLLADRLTATLAGMAPKLHGSEPEFRLLWRHCLVWVCRVFRVWTQIHPSGSGGQLLQPLLKHSRVLPMHFVPGLLLLATCGGLDRLLPKASHSISISPGKVADAASGEPQLPSRAMLMPVSTRGGACGHVVMKTTSGEREGRSQEGREQIFGQFWDTDCELQEWDLPNEEATDAAHAAVCARDSLVLALTRKRETANVAVALGLVSRVTARKDRLSMDDLGEISSLVAECAITTHPVLHLLAVRVMEKLTEIGIPILAMVLRIAESALNGASSGGRTDDAAGTTWASAAASPESAGGAAKDQRDARAVSRLLLLLYNFGQRSAITRRALAEQKAETFCLNVLTHSPANLPSATITQAVNVLKLIFCHGLGPKLSSSSQVACPPVPKCRMLSKALTLLLNRVEDAMLVGPSAIAAALEVLLRLTSVKSMCLNLLFQVADADAGSDDDEAEVTLSCAFRLPQCKERLAKELARWNAAAVEGSVEDEDEEAEEMLMAWLHVGELLVSLCQTVLERCPTVSVFLMVIMPVTSGVRDVVETAMLRGVMADVHESLKSISKKRRSEAVRFRCDALLGELTSLMTALVDTKQGPPPERLSKDDLRIAQSSTAAAEAAEGDDSAKTAAAEGSSEEAVLAELVSLFEEVQELEGNPDWCAAAELDSTETTSAEVAWEFNADTQRQKRKAALEKMEAEREGKRLKQAKLAGNRLEDIRGADATKRRPGEDFGGRPADKVAKKAPESASTAIVPAGGAAADKVAAEKAKDKAPAAAQAAVPTDALGKFVKDHPHFIRVLQNPKKCLSDPRVKSMFVAELDNYPQVKAFLESKGLNFGSS
eukprot:TRINITY_DN74281_c0_g1_i1.p1 TRINITY_DN74281_c0_g1~~TRINITY_DN74281_c0_g1_i1.p1  ORF type:complete len:1849 (+),score=508.48 TRINITY_DN74281_c0_g1_i1:103-5649(+)